VLALSVARSTFPDSAIVWLDCDCELLCELSRGVLAYAFAGEDVFYHKGRARDAMESGIMALRDASLGYLDRTIALYVTGSFRIMDRGPKRPGQSGDDLGRRGRWTAETLHPPSQGYTFAARL
jgi:hypothetical protein